MTRTPFRFSIGAGLFMVCLSSALWAHAYLDQAEPKVGSKVTTSPTEVKIWFTDDPQLAKSAIEVFDAKGTQVDKKDTHGDPQDKAILMVSVPTLAPGTYTVKWHAVCPADHKTEGSFEFTVAGK